MDPKRKKLLEMIPPEIQDFVEFRLQSHTESSLKIVAGLEGKIEELINSNKEMSAILQKHDVFFNKVDPEALAIIAKQWQEMQDFKKVGKSYIKVAGVIAGFLGALYIIKQFFGSLIVFLLPK